MAALDHILDRTVKKLKFPETSWGVSGSDITVSGFGSGSLDWERSRYIRVGREMHFFAYVSGSYLVLDEAMRDGYVEPKQYHMGPISVEIEEDE